MYLQIKLGEVEHRQCFPGATAFYVAAEFFQFGHGKLPLRYKMSQHHTYYRNNAAVVGVFDKRHPVHFLPADTSANGRLAVASRFGKYNRTFTMFYFNLAL